MPLKPRVCRRSSSIQLHHRSNSRMARRSQMAYSLSTIASALLLLLSLLLLSDIPSVAASCCRNHSAAFLPASTHVTCHRNQKTKVRSVVEYDDFLPNPDPSLSAVDVVSACMNTLLQKSKDAGLEVCFQFSNDRCRAAIGGSLDEFAEYANNPVFAYLIDCTSWTIDSVGTEIPGTAHRGPMQTILMRALTEEDTEGRRFLWTLQQERRPPLQGCWTIHEVLYTKNAFHQTV